MLLFKQGELADQIKLSLKFDKKYNLDVIVYNKFKSDDNDDESEIMSEKSHKLNKQSVSSSRTCTLESLDFDDVEYKYKKAYEMEPLDANVRFSLGN